VSTWLQERNRDIRIKKCCAATRIGIQQDPPSLRAGRGGCDRSGDGIHEGGLREREREIHRIGDGIHEGKLRGRHTHIHIPVEAARQHLGRVQGAEAKVKGAICVEVGLVHVLQEEALLVDRQGCRAKKTPARK